MLAIVKEGVTSQFCAGMPKYIFILFFCSGIGENLVVCFIADLAAQSPMAAGVQVCLGWKDDIVFIFYQMVKNSVCASMILGRLTHF